MMKNKYKIVGDVLIVYNHKDNREILFDTDDFDFVNKHTWCIYKPGISEYVGTNIKQPSGNYKFKQAHRLLMNEPVSMLVDHMNGNGLDNRKENLRVATVQVNSHNQRKAKGYYWNKKDRKWRAEIKINKKLIYLGGYNTEDEARAAYLKAKAMYHPTAPIHLYK